MCVCAFMYVECMYSCICVYAIFGAEQNVCDICGYLELRAYMYHVYDCVCVVYVCIEVCVFMHGTCVV